MTWTSIGSSPDGYWSFNSNNAETYPLPDVSTDSTPSLLIGDTTLYAISNFFRNILNSNLQPRFSEDMFNCGVKHKINPNYFDNIAVAQVVFYPLYPNILTTNSFKFPLLSVSQTGMQSIMLSSVKTGIKRDFAVTWILPPMSAAQLGTLQPHLSIAAKAWNGYASIGYDPKISTVSAWKTAGIAFGELGKISMLPFVGTAPVEKSWKEVIFPALTMQLSMWEINQIGIPQPNPKDFTQTYIELDLGDGYNVNNPFDNIADGYVFPVLDIASFSPDSGSIQGDTLVFINGTGFTPNRTYTISFNGAFAKSVSVRSPLILQAITNPSINNEVGSGNIVVEDNFGNISTISGWTYTSP